MTTDKLTTDKLALNANYGMMVREGFMIRWDMYELAIALQSAFRSWWGLPVSDWSHRLTKTGAVISQRRSTL